MKNIRLLTVVLFLVFSFTTLLGCGEEATESSNSFAEIEAGMTDKQVTDLVGTPSDIENAPEGGMIYVFGDDTSVTMSPDNKVVSVTHKGEVLIKPDSEE